MYHETTGLSTGPQYPGARWIDLCGYLCIDERTVPVIRLTYVERREKGGEMNEEQRKWVQSQLGKEIRGQLITGVASEGTHGNGVWFDTVKGRKYKAYPKHLRDNRLGPEPLVPGDNPHYDYCEVKVPLATSTLKSLLDNAHCQECRNYAIESIDSLMDAYDEDVYDETDERQTHGGDMEGQGPHPSQVGKLDEPQGIKRDVVVAAYLRDNPMFQADPYSAAMSVVMTALDYANEKCSQMNEDEEDVFVRILHTIKLEDPAAVGPDRVTVKS